MSTVNFQDSLSFKGEVFFYTFPKDDPENLTEIRVHHNQTQWYGTRMFGKAFCNYLYAGWKPKFSMIKATTAFNQSGTDDNAPILQSALRIPEEWAETGRCVHADSFTCALPKNATLPQYVDCIGTFLSPPPGDTEDTFGTYYHFGLYLSAYADVDEYLFAYHFVSGGISYDTDAGLKVVWRIWLSQ